MDEHIFEQTYSIAFVSSQRLVYSDKAPEPIWSFELLTLHTSNNCFESLYQTKCTNKNINLQCCHDVILYKSLWRLVSYTCTA